MEKVKEQFKQLYQQETVLTEKLEKEYKVLSCIKHSEQKQVYVLLHKTTKEKALLKCSSGQYKEISREECQRLLQMDGNGFPKVLAWEEQQDRSYLVREYIEGDTLQELMERESALTRQEALEAILQVCGLLRKLHEQNPPIIYRDVKPQNLVRTPQGGFVLIDLDTARSYKDGIEEDTVFMGTRGLASPEQYGYQQTDARTDVYGIGMLLLYLVTGDYKKEALLKLPKVLRKVIERCTEFNPKDRYASVREVERQLRKLMQIKDLEQEERRKRKYGVFFLVMTMLLSCGLLGGLFWHYSRETHPQIMEFANPKIERAIREILNKPEGEILPEELDSVRTLIFIDDMVFDSWTEMEDYMANYWYELDEIVLPAEEFELSDLAYFKNLNTLVLEYQNITELPELSRLPLVRVSFANNDIEDISALGQCTEIKTLRLSNNPIEDVRALQNLSKLEYLDVANTAVDDLTAIVSPILEGLYCNHTNVTDYAFLAQCTGLKDVRVSDFTMKEAVYLAGLEGMENLSFFESKVNSLLIFKDMENLKGLELAGNKSLTSLEGIEYLTKLSYLGLSGTGINELPENLALERLNVIELTATGVKDFTPLMNCPRLQILYLGEEMEEEAKEQLEGSGIEITGI